MSKKTIINLILLSVIFLIGIFAYTSIKNPDSKKIINDNSVSIATNLPAETDKLQLTEAELKQYYDSYNDPFVIHIRNSFNNYLVGSTKGISESAIKTERSTDGTVSGLDSFDRSYYKSKFIVFAINDGLMGGKVINIIFQDNPDKLFNAWVYQTTDGSYELRGFWQNMSFDLNEMKKIQNQYKTYLNDREHAL